MAFGVPELGDAYVQVHADTRTMRPEVRRAAEQAGREYGESFGDSAETSLGRQSTRLSRRIEKHLGKEGRLSGVEFAESLENGVRDRMRRFDMDIITGALTGDWSKVTDQFDDFDTAVARVKERFRELREEGGSTGRAVTEMRQSFARWEYEARRSEGFEKIRDDAYRMNVEFDRQRQAWRQAEVDLVKHQALLAKAGDGLRNYAERSDRQFLPALGRMREGVKRTREGMDEWDEAFENLETTLQAAGRGMLAHEDRITGLRNAWRRLRYTVKENEDGYLSLERRHGETFRRMRQQLRDYSGHVSVLGRLTGARNNFLNALGRGAGFFERAFGRTIDLLAEAPDRFARLQKAAEEAGGGFRGWATALKNSADGLIAMAGGLPGIILTLVSLAASLSIGAIAAGAFVSAISGIIGIVTALASSVALAIAGAVLPLAGGLAALVPAAGAAIIAFTDLSDTMKKKLQPIKDWVAEVRKPVQEQLFANLANQVSGLRSVLDNSISPLLVSSAASLREAIDYLIGAFQRPEVAATLENLKTSLPNIFASLSRAATDFSTGLLGMFDALSPYTQKIADGLANIAARFSEIMNDPEKRQEFLNWFEKAWNSAETLMGFINSVKDAVLELFNQGSESGDRMLEKLTDIINKFTEWAQSEEGRRKIKEWLESAERIAGDLARAVGKVGDALIKLDTPENRAMLERLINGFTLLVGVVGSLVGWLSKVSFISLFAAENQAQNLAKAIATVISAVRDLISWVGRIKFPSLPGWIANPGKILGGLAKTATGGVFDGEQARIIGEAGPEAVVPLRRSLSQVDPSVRWLSALAQGKAYPANPSSSGRTVVVEDGAIKIYETTSGAYTAERVLDRIVEDIAR